MGRLEACIGNCSLFVSKFPSILRYALRATQDERKFTILRIITELLLASQFSLYRSIC